MRWRCYRVICQPTSFIIREQSFLGFQKPSVFANNLTRTSGRVNNNQEGHQMRLVKVKKKQEEKTFGKLKLVFTLLNVCELTKENEGTTMDFYQIYNVTEVWSLDEPTAELMATA